MRPRAARLLVMRARHEDGHAWTGAEARGAYSNDSMPAWQMGDACLLLWLRANGALGEAGNWLAP